MPSKIFTSSPFSTRLPANGFLLDFCRTFKPMAYISRPFECLLSHKYADIVKNLKQTEGNTLEHSWFQILKAREMRSLPRVLLAQVAWASESGRARQSGLNWSEPYLKLKFPPLTLVAPTSLCNFC